MESAFARSGCGRKSGSACRHDELYLRGEQPFLCQTKDRAHEPGALGSLELYTALRPRRATAIELEAWAERLEHELGAARTAAFVREALRVYEQRGLLAVDEQSPTQI